MKKLNRKQKYALGSIIGQLAPIAMNLGNGALANEQRFDPYGNYVQGDNRAFQANIARNTFNPIAGASQSLGDPNASTKEKLLSVANVILPSGMAIMGARSRTNRLEKQAKAEYFQSQHPQTTGESYNPYYMARGGMMGGMQSAELENGEPFRLPNGDIEGVYGKTHAQGGEDYMLPQGTQILGKNMSKEYKEKFKDIGMRLKRAQDGHEKTLENKHSTNIARRTSEIMMDRIKDEYTGLMQEQEMNKLKSGLKKFKLGGYIPYTGSLTGENLAYDPTNFSEQNFLAEQQDNITNGVAMKPWNELPGTTGFQSDVPFNQGPSQSRPSFDQSKFANTLGTVGELAPILYNLGQGMFGQEDKYNYQTYTNPYIADIRSAMRNRRYNIQPELESNRTAQANYNYNLRNAGASPSQVYTGLQAGAVSRARGDANAYAQQSNMNNEYLGQQAQMDASLGEGISRLKQYGYEANQKNRAAKRNYMSTGLSQLQQYYQMKKIMKGQQNNDAIRTKILADMFSNYRYNPNAKDTAYDFLGGNE